VIWVIVSQSKHEKKYLYLKHDDYAFKIKTSKEKQEYTDRFGSPSYKIKTVHFLEVFKNDKSIDLIRCESHLNEVKRKAIEYLNKRLQSN